MNSDPNEHQEQDEEDDSFVDNLIAWDDALATGDSSAVIEQNAMGAADEQRLARTVRCLRLLRQVGTGRHTISRKSELTAAELESSSDDIPKQFGRFEIRHELGRGGFGVVFLAHDPQLNREVALKVPHAGVITRPELRARFKNEARSVAGLDHPNIVQVYEAGDVGPICFIASAYCPGPNLREWLADRLELVPYSEAARLISTLAEAVEHAHVRGVFHRDLTPANIILQLVSKVQDQPSSIANAAGQHEPKSLNRFVPRITDFGLAKNLNESSMNTTSGAMLGTPCYMAPEQAGGKTVIEASVDIYALGAILYQLLTGYVPFHGDSPIETLQQVQTQEPVAPTRLRKSVPRDLETICLKCLQKNPIERYESAQYLADDLHRYLRSEPIFARPISNFERFCRLCHRSPLAVTLSTALVASILVGLVGVSILWQISEVRRMDTEVALTNVRKANIVIEERNQRSERLLYLHDIALVHSESSIHIDRALPQLQNCSKEHRNWEWNYLNQVCHSEICTLREHTLPVRACKFSADGLLLATCSGYWGTNVPGEVILWNTQTGTVRRKFTNFPSSVIDVAMHPNGKWLATAEYYWGPGYDPGGVRLWDIDTGQLIGKYESSISTFGLAISHHGQYLLAADYLGKIRVFETSTMKCMYEISGHDQNAFSVSVHPNDRIFASGGRDGVARIWDIENGKLQYELNGYGDVRNVAFSPDGKQLAISNYSGAMHVVDLKTKQESAHHYSNTARIAKLAWSPDSQSIAIATNTEGIEILDVATGAVQSRFPGHFPSSWGVAFSTDGTQLATSGHDSSVRIWDLTAGSKPQKFAIQPSFIRDIATIPNSSTIALASMRSGGKSPGDAGDFMLRIVEPNTGRIVKVLKGHTDWLTCVASTTEGRLLASGSLDKTIRLWSTGSDDVVMKLDGHMEAIADVAFCRADRWLASASADHTIRIWDVESGNELFVLQGHSGAVNCIVASTDGNWLASGGEDHSIRIWNLNDRTQHAVLKAHLSPVTNLAFNRENNRLLSAGKESAIHCWNMQSILVNPKRVGEDLSPELTIVSPDPEHCCISFSPDSTRFLTASPHGIVRLWDSKYGCEALRLYDVDVDKTPPMSIFSESGQQIFVAAGTGLVVFDGPPSVSGIAERREQLEKRRPSWSRTQLADAEHRKRNGFATLFYLKNESETPENRVSLTVRRGNAYAEMNDWENADNEFARAIELNSSLSDLYVRRLLLKLIRSDFDGYLEVFDKMRFEFLYSHNDTDINNLAWAASLTFEPLPDRSALADLLDESIARSQSKDSQYFALNTKAALLMRLERYQQAYDAMRQALRAKKKKESPLDNILLSIIERHLNLTSEADRHLSLATQEIETESSRRLENASWLERLTNSLFLRDANRVTADQTVLKVHTNPSP